MKRRRYLRTSGGLLGAFVLAGCPGEPGRPELTRPPPPTGEVDRIEAIRYQGHDVPMEEVRAVTGSECDGEHYHAATGSSVRTTLCETIPDPGGCGFGKVSETPVEERVQFDYPCSDG